MRAAVIEWRIKESLLAYMRRDPGFAVTLARGAEFDPESGVRLPAVVQPDGSVAATGAAVLSAHGGALAVPLVNAVIADGALWIDDPIEAEPGGAPARLRLVTLHPADDGAAGDPGAALATRLAPEADVLFLYNYVPATPFGALSIRYDDDGSPEDIPHP